MKANILLAICLLWAAILAPSETAAQVVIEKEVVTDTTKKSKENDLVSQSLTELSAELQKLGAELQKLQLKYQEKAREGNEPEVDRLRKEMEELGEEMEKKGEQLEEELEEMMEKFEEEWEDEDWFDDDDDDKEYSYKYEYKYQDGDTVVTKTGDSLFRNQIVIRINDDGVVVKKGDKEEKIKKNKKRSKRDLPKYKTQILGLDLGVNSFAQKLNGPGSSTERDPMTLDVAKSVNVTLHLFRQGISLYRNHLYLTMGIALDFHNYRLDEDISLTPETDSFRFTVLPENLKRNKLEANYVTVPLMLHYESNPRNPNRSFKLGVGGYGGVRFGSYTKQVNTEGKKEKYHDDFNLNPINYGVRGQVGYGPLTLYSHYALSPLFADGVDAPELNPVTVGIVVNGFKWR